MASGSTDLPRIVLASASPRRADLLRAAGIAFDIIVADVDETPQPGERAFDYVRRLARDKAEAVRARAGNAPVLAADTAVVIDGEILGKPRDGDDATRMLRLLSGRVHEVLTGICLDRYGLVETTTVEFAPMEEQEIAWYVASGEPMDKAGAYAIQGLASRFVRRIDGSYSNVVGLPVALVYELLRRLT
jgi:septum formation protein